MEEQAQSIEKALQSSEAEILETLGARSIAIWEKPEVAGSYEPVVPVAQIEAVGETLQELGRRIVRRLSRELYKLLCGTDPEDSSDRKKLADVLGLGEAAVAGALTGILVTGFGVAPAIATLVAVLIAKRIIAPTLDEFCKFWGEQLPQS
jgi:hypothetical protein